MALHRQPWAAAFSSNKPPTTEFTRFDFHQHLGAVPKALRRKKRSILHQRFGLWERPLDGFGFSKGKNLGRVWKMGIFYCTLENRGQGGNPVIAGAAINGRPPLDLWHLSPNKAVSTMVSADGRALLHIFYFACCLKSQAEALTSKAAHTRPHPVKPPQPAPDPNPISVIYHDLQTIIDFLSHKVLPTHPCSKHIVTALTPATTIFFQIHSADYLRTSEALSSHQAQHPGTRTELTSPAKLSSSPLTGPPPPGIS